MSELYAEGTDGVERGKGQLILKGQLASEMVLLYVEGADDVEGAAGTKGRCLNWTECMLKGQLMLKGKGVGV